MTNQRELDRVLGDFFASGTTELADRVIDAALAQIEDTEQRHPMWVPRRFATMHLSTRFAVAAVIAALAVGGALYALRPNQPPVGGPSPTIDASSSPTAFATAPAKVYGWTSAANYPGIVASTATLLADGTVLVTAGSNPLAARFDPTTGSWKSAGPMIDPRPSRCSLDPEFTATRLPDGKVLVAGGDDFENSRTGQTDRTLAAAELYDPDSGAWTVAAPMLNARGSFTATLLRSGQVLVAGGFTGGCQETPLASAELYDPTSGSWTVTGQMSEARFGATATLLPDGKVLVAGGENPGNATFPGGVPVFASAEIYDPTSAAWTATGPMTVPRTDFTATLLPNGKVLVVGGSSSPYGSGTLTSTELYDPTTGSWIAAAPMTSPLSCCGPEGRAGHTATLLPDGRVLVAGGGLSSSELYDPVNGAWTEAARMRDGYNVTALLLDGRVLAIGGVAELYGPEGGS